MSINFDSDKPIYLQLADRIREAIMAGDLQRGEAIPSVRRLSAEYRLNPQTILNATQLLVNEGLLEKQRGRGYFVTDLAQGSLKKSAVAEFEEESVPALVRQAKMLNISRDALMEMIKKHYNK